MEQKVKILSGNSNRKLAEEIASYLKIPLTPVELERFADGEIYCQIKESVRGSTVFVIQPTSPPANESLMELLIMVDALRRASAKEINAVIPYYGYARQDRKTVPREPITAKLVADMLVAAGVHRVVTFDLHVDQIQGFFQIPSDNLEALPLLTDYLLDKRLKDIVVVSPDAGGTARARRLAKLLNASLATIDKRRPERGKAQVFHVIGDVKNKTAILVDDMIDTAGTLLSAATALKDKGAKDIYACATHAVFSGPAAERLKDDVFREIVVTNTIQLPKEKMLPKIKVISVAPLLAEAIKRIYEGTPMGVLFEGIYQKLQNKKDKNGKGRRERS